MIRFQYTVDPGSIQYAFEIKLTQALQSELRLITSNTPLSTKSINHVMQLLVVRKILSYNFCVIQKKIILFLS